eukprot:403357815
MEIRFVKQIPLIDAFSKRYTFEDDINLEVFMDFKRIKDEDITAIINGISSSRHIKSLKIGGESNYFFNSSLFRFLAGNETIEELDLEISNLNQENFYAFCYFMRTNQTIKSLALRKFNFLPHTIAHLVDSLASNQNSTLIKLDLHDIQFGSLELNQFLAYFAEINPPKLEFLGLSFLKDVYKGSINNIMKNNTHLTTLHLKSIQYHDENESFANFELHKNLTELVISYSKIDPVSVQNISQAIRTTNLKKLVLDGVYGIIQDFEWRKMSEVIGQSITMTHLEFQDCKIQNLGLVLENVGANKFLQSLIMQQCKADKKCLSHISQLVKKNENLKILKISGNNFDFCTQQLELSSALEINQTLEELEIENINLFDDFWRFLIPNKTLKHLRLTIQPHQLNNLLEVVKQNHGLETLDIMKVRLPLSELEKIENVKNVKIYYYDDKM